MHPFFMFGKLTAVAMLGFYLMTTLLGHMLRQRLVKLLSRLSRFAMQYVRPCDAMLCDAMPCHVMSEHAELYAKLSILP